MVVWIHPDGNKADYIAFRTAVDREYGYPSLCVKHVKLVNNSGNNHNLIVSAANNAMKINVRVSGKGVNHYIQPTTFFTDAATKHDDYWR